MDPGSSRCTFRLKFIEYGSVKFGFVTLKSKGSNALKSTDAPLFGEANGNGLGAVPPPAMSTYGLIKLGLPPMALAPKLVIKNGAALSC